VTTEPGVPVCSANNVEPGQFSGLGVEIHKRDGLALETQHFADSPNCPEFPPTLLRLGETLLSTPIVRSP